MQGVEVTGRNSVAARQDTGLEQRQAAPDEELEAPWDRGGWGAARQRTVSGGTPQPAAPGARPSGCSFSPRAGAACEPHRTPSPRSDCRLSRGLVERGGSLG